MRRVEQGVHLVVGGVTIEHERELVEGHAALRALVLPVSTRSTVMSWQANRARVRHRNSAQVAAFSSAEVPVQASREWSSRAVSNEPALRETADEHAVRAERVEVLQHRVGHVPAVERTRHRAATRAGVLDDLDDPDDLPPATPPTGSASTGRQERTHPRRPSRPAAREEAPCSSERES
ncbi:hypothetical protein [Salinifilum aidingensis]